MYYSYFYIILLIKQRGGHGADAFHLPAARDDAPRQGVASLPAALLRRQDIIKCLTKIIKYISHCYLHFLTIFNYP